MGVSQLVGLLGSVGTLLGGKPDTRPAREDELYAMIANKESYAINAARIIWWRHSNAGSAADGKENSVVWGEVQRNFPALATQAMALGPLTDVASSGVPATGTYRPSAFPSNAAYNSAAAQVAGAVQQIGTGLTNTATSAIAPRAGNLAIGTNIGTILLLVVVLGLGIFLIRHRGRR
jgi:hypothetical protein